MVDVQAKGFNPQPSQEGELPFSPPFSRLRPPLSQWGIMTRKGHTSALVTLPSHRAVGWTAVLWTTSEMSTLPQVINLRLLTTFTTSSNGLNEIQTSAVTSAPPLDVDKGVACNLQHQQAAS